MNITLNKLFFEYRDRFGYKYCIGRLKCSKCDGFLSGGYIKILTKLNDLLPKDYEPLCCWCLVLKTYHHQCHCGSHNIGIVYLNKHKRANIYCRDCYEDIVSIPVETVLSETREYLVKKHANKT